MADRWISLEARKFLADGLTVPGGITPVYLINVKPVGDDGVSLVEGGRLKVDLPAGGGGLTDNELRAAPIEVEVTSMPAGGASLTDAELRASPVEVDTGVVPVTDNGGSLTVDGSVAVTNFPASQTVSGTVTVGNASIAVTGTFWQATQPVSIAATVAVSGPLTDAQLRAVAVPVSGTFWQATQPVSGPLTDAQLRAVAVPVSGTFYPATQPISAAALPLPADAATQTTLALIKAKTDNLDVALSTRAVTGLTDAQLRAAAVPVSGTFFQATQPVSLAALPALVASSANIGDVDVLTLPALPAGSNNIGDVDVLTLPALPAGNNNIGDVDIASVPTLTKGTQGATGFTVQPLRDAGRTLCTWVVSALATVTSEALIQLTPYKDLTAGSPATTFAVTSGKKLRLQGVYVTIRCTSTVNVGGIVRFRMLAGTVLVGSPVHASVGGQGSNLATAVAGNAQTYWIEFPEGFELSGTMQFGLTQLFSATSATIDVHVVGYEY